MRSLAAKGFLEALGTLLLVYFGAGAVAITAIISAQNTNTSLSVGALGGMSEWLSIGAIFGLTLATLIYSFGRFTDLHLNPAVSSALWLIGKINASEAIVAIVCQMIGAVGGSLLFAATAGSSAVTIGMLGATVPSQGIGMGHVIVAEAIGTFLLMSVIMATIRERERLPYSGLLIGMTVAGIVASTGHIAGASLNTARTFGPYMGDWLLGGPNLWTYFPAYIFGPLLGAMIAAIVSELLDRRSKEN